MILMTPIITEDLKDYCIESSDNTELTLFPVPQNVLEDAEIMELLTDSVFQISIIKNKVKVFKFRLEYFRGRFLKVFFKTKAELDRFDKIPIETKNELFLYHQDKKFKIFDF